MGEWEALLRRLMPSWLSGSRGLPRAKEKPQARVHAQRVVAKRESRAKLVARNQAARKRKRRLATAARRRNR